MLNEKPELVMQFKYEQSKSGCPLKKESLNNRIQLFGYIKKCITENAT